MYVLRWILGHPIVSILIFSGLLAVANWGNLYRSGSDSLHEAVEHAAETQTENHAASGDASVTGEASHEAAVVAQQGAVVEASKAGAVVGHEPVTELASAATVNVSAGEGNATASEIAAAETEVSDNAGAKSLFDFFKGDKSDKPVESGHEPVAQATEVKEEVVAGEGKKSLFDFFKGDKSAAPEGSAAAPAAPVAEAPKAEAVAGETKPFLQIVNEDTPPALAAPAAAVASVEVPEAPAPVAEVPAQPGPVTPVPEPVSAPAIPALPAPVAELPVPVAPAVQAPAAQAVAPAPVSNVPMMPAPAQPTAPAQARVELAPAQAPQQVMQPPRPPKPIAPRDQFYGSLLYARRAFWEKEYDAAYATYRNLVTANPNNPDLLGEFGNLLVQMNRAGEALEVYNHAAEILIEQGRFREAHPLVGYIGSIDKNRAMRLVEMIRTAR